MGIGKRGIKWGRIEVGVRYRDSINVSHFQLEFLSCFNMRRGPIRGYICTPNIDEPTS